MSVPVSLIHQLLLGPAAKQIDFISNGHVRTGGHGFARLARCFADGPVPQRIRVTTNPAIVGRDHARYDTVDDKINVRSDAVLDTIEGTGAFLHECVHAMHDLAGFGQMNVFLTEVPAFVAEAWFYYNISSDQAEVDRLVGPVISEIARDLRAAARSATGSAPVVMSSSQFNSARQAARGFGYRPGAYRMDGLRGHVERP